MYKLYLPYWSFVFVHAGYFSLFQTFVMLLMFYSFLWVIPRRLNFICRHFGTLCLLRLHRSSVFARPTSMEHAECSETSPHKIQMTVNHPKERIQKHIFMFIICDFQIFFFCCLTTLLFLVLFLIGLISVVN